MLLEISLLWIFHCEIFPISTLYVSAESFFLTLLPFFIKPLLLELWGALSSSCLLWAAAYFSCLLPLTLGIIRVLTHDVCIRLMLPLLNPPYPFTESPVWSVFHLDYTPTTPNFLISDLHTSLTQFLLLPFMPIWSPHLFKLYLGTALLEGWFPISHQQIKTYFDGSLECDKAHLVVHGLAQQYKINYWYVKDEPYVCLISGATSTLFVK